MNDKLKDFKELLPDYIRSEEDFKLYKMRHSAEHLLMMAMQQEFGPDSFHMAMGPATEEGFYFDFEPLNGLEVSEAKFKKLEKRISKLIKRELPFRREEVSLAEAKKLFKDNPYKQEWLAEIKEMGGSASLYWTGDKFVDLCKGPHVDNTGEIGVVKLMSIAGAYWRGDENNKMLVRIYGTAFSTQEELDAYVHMLEEARKRDHRKLSKELELVVYSELVGSGLPMYTPRGAIIRNAVYNYSRELNNKIGYGEVSTPNFNRAELFKISGHYDKYKEDMLTVISSYSDEEMYFKPMNCPQHTQIFASKTRSYRDLPIRYADFANLARDERPGEIHGLLRTRVFTQDDGHAFVRPDQIKQEFQNVLGVIREALNVYGMNYWVRLSLRDPKSADKYLGDDEVWNKSESLLRELVEEEGVDYKAVEGEAAIYGPKMDFIAVDSLKREWQLSTIQIDMNMPERFELKYTAEDGSEQRPVMIHRAIVGSERFIGIIIEHFGGAFPTWLAPEQVRIIPITDENIGYAEQIASELEENNVRIEIDRNKDRMQKKIRNAQKMKVPYMLIVGKQEETDNTVSVRLLNGEEYKDVKFSKFLPAILDNIESKSLEAKSF